MENRYQDEIDSFNSIFEKYKDKRIVLYGIGRLTGTLLEYVDGFNIVGLMDKDQSKTGQVIYGKKIVSKEEAEQQADMVIINTQPVYWHIIFDRISDITIPVYNLDGTKATPSKSQTADAGNPYWRKNIEELERKACEADVVSFDFFDTFFLRRIYTPTDVFSILDILCAKYIPDGTSYSELRRKVINNLHSDYTLDDLYNGFLRYDISESDASEMKRLELDLEERLMYPRQCIVSLLKKLQSADKEIYIISDMYLPRIFYERVLKKYDISIYRDHLIISNEIKKNKNDGSLWRWFSEKVADRKVLHIGDNAKADGTNAEQYGIDTYIIASPEKIASISSLSKTDTVIRGNYSSAIVGMIQAKLFNDPFAVSKDKGDVVIDSFETMGYVVFGPVLLTFFRWLLEEAEKDGTKRLLFMARDGYILKKDFEEYLSLTDQHIYTAYIANSRPLAMTAAIENDADMKEYMDMPYIGSLCEKLESRFGIHTDKNFTENDIPELMPQIWDYVNTVKKNYKRYLSGFSLNENDVVVDSGYAGNNQRYFNKIIGLNLKGYYLVANTDKSNPNTKVLSLKGCFNKGQTIPDKCSNVRINVGLFESFCTAPYGMICAVDEDVKYICAEKTHNQMMFDDNEKINDGVQDFIRDYVEIYGDLNLKNDPDSIDDLLGVLLNGGVQFTKRIKDKFWYENLFYHKSEEKLFE